MHRFSLYFAFFYESDEIAQPFHFYRGNENVQIQRGKFLFWMNGMIIKN